MTAIEILQTIHIDAERRLAQLNSRASRLYDISMTGAIVECTVQMREYYQGLGQQLQRAIDALQK